MTRLTEPRTSSLSFDLLGYRATVTAPDDMLAMIAAVFSDLRITNDSPAEVTHYHLICDATSRCSLFVDEACVYGGTGETEALVALEWRLVTDLVAYRRDYFHLHAAALADPTGSCSMLIVGMSGSGKTTLALGLMARGFLPYADDVALIAPATLTPQPLRRAFHADDATRALIAAMGAPPVWRSAPLPEGYLLPVWWATADVPIRAILFPTLAPAAPPALAPLSVADAVTALLPYSMTLSHDPALALAVAARLTRDARCYTLSTGDLDATVACVQALIARACAPASVS